MQKSVEYLGYQLTTDGIGPQPKKIEAMEQVLPPQNSKQLKRFLGMIISTEMDSKEGVTFLQH